MSDTTSELTEYQEHIKNVINLLRELDGGEEAFQSLVAAERQRWEVAARSELFMALIATAETVGALDAHDIERMRQAALDGELGKEQADV